MRGLLIGGAIVDQELAFFSTWAQAGAPVEKLLRVGREQCFARSGAGTPSAQIAVNSAASGWIISDRDRSE